jgi:hypothetical protein
MALSGELVQDTFTLADLVEVTGAKRRSLQLWAERSVIRALPQTESAGTGVHRLFSRDEAIIACIVHAFAMRHIAIGGLKDISLAVRSFIDTESSLVYEAIGGSGHTMLNYETWYAKGKPRNQISMSTGGKIFAESSKPWHMSMVIRLETYLAKLT